MNWEKAQKILFYLLVVLMPVQLGKHFWFDFSFVSGVRVDYLSPTLYLTDLLVLGMFFLELVKGFLRISRKLLGVLGVVGVLGMLNIYFSLSPAVSLYKWLRVLELGFLVWFVYRNQIRVKIIAWLLLFPVFFESILVFWQFYAQSSVGFWIFGERTFTANTVGVANTVIDSQIWLRPYGTFPHPNALGGWLAVVLPLIIYYFPHKHRRIAATVLGVGLGALILSLSRAAIGVGLAATGLVFWFKHKTRYVVFLVVLGMVFFLGLARGESESLTVREKFNDVALVNFINSPILGSGLGTSPIYKIKVDNFALVHQPTHNIYLMVLAELGIIGVVVWVGFFGVIFRVRKSFLAIPLLSIAVMGFFDHYFLTLQQTQLLFAIVLGFGLKLGDEV